MTVDDLPSVLTLWAATAGVGLNESDTLEQLAAYLHRNPSLSLVARDDARIIAAVLCGHDGRRGYLHHLAVAPDFRRQGLGRKMVDNCLAALHHLGILKCNLFLFADNDPGAKFWTNRGWSNRQDLQVLQRPTDA
jgi:putative acetyltransferase